jgi:hypothetical protein
LAEDADTSIALQAAWELHRKPVKRHPPIPRRTDWVFDKQPMEECLRFVAKRLKAQPPAWWAATLLKGDVFPNQHHAFIDLEDDLPAAAKVEVGNEKVTVKSGKQSITLPKEVYDKSVSSPDIGTPPVALLGAGQSFIARPWARGYPFEVIGLDSRTGRKLWTALVWAARRGVHRETPKSIRWRCAATGIR